MAYRNGNYSAFYVTEPFNESNLGANATKDSMPLFIMKYSNNKVLLLSSKGCYDFVDGYLKQNKIQGLNIGHLTLSISDKYGIMNWSWSK